jgi:hypothetical protein
MCLLIVNDWNVNRYLLIFSSYQRKTLLRREVTTRDISARPKGTW